MRLRQLRGIAVSNRYAREYLCPDPEEHGEIVFRRGVLRRDRWFSEPRWRAIEDVPICPICGVEMVHDNDDCQPEVEIILVRREGSP